MVQEAVELMKCPYGHEVYWILANPTYQADKCKDLSAFLHFTPKKRHFTPHTFFEAFFMYNKWIITDFRHFYFNRW